MIIALTGPIESILAFNKLTAGMWRADAVGWQNVMICLTYIRMKRSDTVTPFLQPKSWSSSGTHKASHNLLRQDYIKQGHHKLVTTTDPWGHLPLKIAMWLPVMFSVLLEAVCIPQHASAYKQMRMITTRQSVVRRYSSWKCSLYKCTTLKVDTTQNKLTLCFTFQQILNGENK